MELPLSSLQISSYHSNIYPFLPQNYLSLILESGLDIFPDLRIRAAELLASAYNFGRRLKALKGLTLYEFVCKRWKTEPERFPPQSALANAGTDDGLWSALSACGRIPSAAPAP